jgi:hypothetical protein
LERQEGDDHPEERAREKFGMTVLWAALVFAQTGQPKVASTSNARSDVGFVTRLLTALGAPILCAHFTDGRRDYRGYSVKLTIRKAERLAKKSLTADHIAFRTIPYGLSGIVKPKSGPIKGIYFVLSPMKLDQHLLGIDGTEKTWSNVSIMTVSRYRQNLRPMMGH